MEAFAVQAKDRELIQLLRLYECFPKPVIAKQIAKLLKKKKHEKNHGQLISECLKEENKKYPRRTFSKEADKNLNQLLKKARQKDLNLRKKASAQRCFVRNRLPWRRMTLIFMYIYCLQNGWHKKRVTVEEIK